MGNSAGKNSAHSNNPGVAPGSSPRSSGGGQLYIWALILAALVVRLFPAFMRLDSHWPDEQFQSLEPAGRAVFGYGLLSWEWTSGYRSWFLPGLYIPLFWVLKQFGINGGPWPIWFGRGLTAVVATTTLVPMDVLLRRLRVSLAARVLALASLSFSTAMILWSTATLGDIWAMVAIWGVLPRILSLAEGTTKRRWIWIGVLAGLPALIKFQMAAWIAGLMIALFLNGASIRSLLWMIAGGSIDFLALGAVDWITWGVPYHSLIEQVSKGNSISKFYGVAPWFAFFPEIYRDLGVEIFFALLASVILTLAVPAWRRSVLTLFWRDPGARKIFRALLIPLVLFTAMLMSIEHKEERFMLPVMPLLYFVLGVFAHAPLSAAASAIKSAMASTLKNKTPSAFKPAILATLFLVGFLIGLFAAAFHATRISLGRPLYLTTVNIGELEAAIHADGGLSPRGDSCLLVLGHNWSWSHGYLILGASVRLVDEKPEKLKDEDLKNCYYAIVSDGEESGFVSRAGAQWKKVRRASTSYTLYKRYGGDGA